jgi:hypothetical protein
MFNPEDFVDRDSFQTIRGNIRIEIVLIQPPGLNNINSVVNPILNFGTINMEQLNPERLARLIGNKFFGEPYYTTTNFYPTLIFLFLEDYDLKGPLDKLRVRKSQIRIRFTKFDSRKQTISIKEIDMIRERCFEFRDLQYTFGTSRYTYVSNHNCKWKTSKLSNDNKQAIIDLLTKLTNLLEEEFDPGRLSITTGRNLSNRKIVRDSKPDQVLLKIHKIVLQIYNKESQVTLFRSRE